LAPEGATVTPNPLQTTLESRSLYTLLLGFATRMALSVSIKKLPRYCRVEDVASCYLGCPSGAIDGALYPQNQGD
jgi:hypothetical protein